MSATAAIVDEFTASELRRLRDAIDSISGPFVTRSGDTITIGPPPKESTRRENQTDGDAPELFRVWGVRDNGSAGSRTTRCTYTYSIYDKQGGTLLADGLTPYKRRPLRGLMINYLSEPGGLSGEDMWAYRVGSDVRLYDANETVDVGDCAI